MKVNFYSSFEICVCSLYIDNLFSSRGNYWNRMLYRLVPSPRTNINCNISEGVEILFCFPFLSFSSVHVSRSVVSDSLQPHESQHARPPCPSPTPGVLSDSCPLSQWCHQAISSSVVPFSSCPQLEDKKNKCVQLLPWWIWVPIFTSFYIAFVNLWTLWFR